MLAARFLGEVGDVRRFPTKHHFAAHTGTAPLAASSGQVVRRRLVGLIVWVWPAARSAGGTATAVGGIGQHLQPRLLRGQQPDPGRAVWGVGRRQQPLPFGARPLARPAHDVRDTRRT